MDSIIIILVDASVGATLLVIQQILLNTIFSKLLLDLNLKLDLECLTYQGWM